MTSAKLQKLTKIAAEKHVTIMSLKLVDIRCLSWKRVTKKERTTERKIIYYMTTMTILITTQMINLTNAST